jgi:hypothetical protein
MKELIKKASDEAFKWAKKTLQYARINDEKNKISLTNLAMMIVMYKMVITQATSWQDMTALAIAILGYQAKRVIECKHKDKDKGDDQ